MSKSSRNILKTAILISCLAILTSAFAQQTSAPTSASARLSSKEIVASLTAAVRPHQAAISPDGTQVAWVQPTGGEETDHAIFVAGIGAGAQPQRITAPNCKQCNEDGIAWSPDGKQVAFLSDAGSKEQSQLYVAEIGGGSARKLTNLTGYLADPKWSRDGKLLAILFTENAPRTAGPLAPMTPPSGVIDEKVYEQRLTIIDPAGGEPRQISPPEMYVYEYDWSPDNNSFAVIAAPGSGDANWYIAQLYTLPAAGSALKSVLPSSWAAHGAGTEWAPATAKADA